MSNDRIAYDAAHPMAFVESGLASVPAVGIGASAIPRIPTRWSGLERRRRPRAGIGAPSRAWVPSRWSRGAAPADSPSRNRSASATVMSTQLWSSLPALTVSPHRNRIDPRPSNAALQQTIARLASRVVRSQLNAQVLDGQESLREEQEI